MTMARKSPQTNGNGVPLQNEGSGRGGVAKNQPGPFTAVEPRPFLRVTLPMPPSANVYWRVFRGVPVKSEAARVYERDVHRLVGAKPIAGGHVLALKFLRLRKDADLSNRLKVLEDALNLRAWVDDSQAIAIHLERDDSAREPGVVVEVSGPRWATAEEIAVQKARNAARTAALRKGRATRRRNHAKRSKRSPLSPTPAVYRPGAKR
jgi:crossover junction endodeoxyribonuclease RusA